MGIVSPPCALTPTRNASHDNNHADAEENVDFPLRSGCMLIRLRRAACHAAASRPRLRPSLQGLSFEPHRVAMVCAHSPSLVRDRCRCSERSRGLEYLGMGYVQQGSQAGLSLRDIMDVSKDNMPPLAYRWIHREISLTTQDRALLADWATAERKRLRLVADKPLASK